MIRNSQGRFLLCFFFSFFIQSQGQDKQVFLLFLSVKLFSFLTHWEFCFLGRPGFMEESQIDFYLASAPKLCLQFIKLQWCCDWHGTEVLGFGNYNFFYSGIPGFLVILVMYLKYYLSKIWSAFLGIMYGDRGSSTDLWSAVLPEMEVFSWIVFFLLICTDVTSWKRIRGCHQSRSLIIMTRAVLGLTGLIRYVVTEENIGLWSWTGI